jgi:serine/threonine protein kinase
MDTTEICSGCQEPLAPNAPDGLCPACLMKAGLGTGVEIESDSEAEGARTRFVAPTPDELVKPFPELEILGFIGQGGMGAVYKARQKALDRVIALKILPPGIGGDPSFAQRFAREAQALAKLNHPGIVTLYEFGQADGLFFFLMEFVDGVNLRHLLEAGRVSPREALAIVPQICDALQCAHDQGIVHRDIKPENILLDRQGRVKVADFGLAKLVRSGALALPMGENGEAAPGEGTVPSVVLTEAGKVMGTPQYMAPEQWQAPTTVDHHADIYSLGVVLYQMLTGELPGKRIEPPSHTVRVDVRLDEVVLRALEKEPERRYQQVSQMKSAMETIAATPPPRNVSTPAAPADASHTNTQPSADELSPWCRIVGIALVDGTFTSPLAIKLVNVSATGFLGALAFLSFVPLPGMHRCSVFAGFYGFFGLIGFAVIIELFSRRKAKKAAGNPPNSPPSQPTGTSPRPELQADAPSPRLLKGDASFVTTPEQLGTFHAQFFLWRCRSQLLLDDRQLTVSRAGTFTVIPLAAIRDLSIGHYPVVLNFVGLDFISVTYDEDGETKRLFFSPYESWLGLPSTFNRFVAEWFAAIRAAVVTATGREPGNTPANQLGVPSGSKAIYALLLAPVVLGGTMVAVLHLKDSGGGSPPAPEREPPKAAVATVPMETQRQNRVLEVRCEGPKASIRTELDDLHELHLFIGSDALGWSASQTGSTSLTATVEASNQMSLADGSLGSGLIFQAWGIRHNIAITSDGPVPYGEVVFRPNSRITNENGTFTFADIRQANGRLVPVSTRVRPRPSAAGGDRASPRSS